MNLPGGVPLPPPVDLADSADSASPPPEEPPKTRWLEQFHRGDRQTLEACYREHFGTVERAIGTLLGGADRETAIHELFSRLISSAELRRSFQGGTFAAWLATVARNQAIDTRRKAAREISASTDDPGASEAGNWEEAAQARLLVERFRRDLLPPDWQGVFELRFLQQLPQREAATRLSMHRTTLAYREIRIRRLLRRFLLEDDPSSQLEPPSQPPLKKGKP